MEFAIQKILLLEDIIPVALAIQSKLSGFDVQAFHNAHSFLKQFQQASFKNYLSQVDFFILDFDLGDASIVSSSIYRYILENKKNNAYLCCISSYSPPIIEAHCQNTYKNFNLNSAFDFYLKKDPEEVLKIIHKLIWLH